MGMHVGHLDIGCWCLHCPARPLCVLQTHIGSGQSISFWEETSSKLRDSIRSGSQGGCQTFLPAFLCLKDPRIGRVSGLRGWRNIPTQEWLSSTTVASTLHLPLGSGFSARKYNFWGFELRLPEAPGKLLS